MSSGSKINRDTSLKIATWNIRSLRRKDKLVNVIREMKRAGISILGLSETHWKEDGDFDSEGIRVIHAGGEQSQRGVALLLDERTARSVTKIDRCSDRILRVKIQAKPINIQVYMPTTAADDEEIDTIYDHLEEMLDEEKLELNMLYQWEIGIQFKSMMHISHN